MFEPIFTRIEFLITAKGGGLTIAPKCEEAEDEELFDKLVDEVSELAGDDDKVDDVEC